MRAIKNGAAPGRDLLRHRTTGDPAAAGGSVPDGPDAHAGARGADLRALLVAGELDLPRPGGGATGRRWAALADWGRRDPATARLVEGHADAVAILGEAGRTARPDAVYGVWAARSGGTGARLTDPAERGPGSGRSLHGTVRFCSGARSLDRALVVAQAADGASWLVEVGLADQRIVAEPGTWQTAAMSGADTLDVRFADVPVTDDALVEGPGWYTARPGFALGGAGVAAVWCGAARGILDRIVGHLPPEPDAHQLAHLGELHALLRAAEALLAQLAAAVDAAPGADRGGIGPLEVAEARCAVERAAREVLDRGPRMVGPSGLSRDADLARSLADLTIYLRQHHGERDHAALARLLLSGPAAR